jgi:hypothetical protein
MLRLIIPVALIIPIAPIIPVAFTKAVRLDTLGNDVSFKRERSPCQLSVFVNMSIHSVENTSDRFRFQIGPMFLAPQWLHFTSILGAPTVSFYSKWLLNIRIGIS